MEKPEVGGTYTSSEGTISLADREKDGRVRGIVSTSHGRGGESMHNKLVVPWEEYVDLWPSERELVISNMHLIVEPPIGYQQYVMSHVLAFYEKDDWLAAWLGGSYTRDLPEYEWEIDPFFSDFEEARMPKNIDDVYDKYELLHEKIDYKSPEPGRLYLDDHDNIILFSRRFLSHRRLNSTRFKIGKMSTVEVDIDSIDIIPVEEAAEMNEERLWELYDDDSTWVQSYTDTDDHIERMRMVYYIYARPYSITTRLLMMKHNVTPFISRTYDDTWKDKVREKIDQAKFRSKTWVLEKAISVTKHLDI